MSKWLKKRDLFWYDPWEAAVNKINAKHADLLSAAAASGHADVHNLLGQRTVAEQAQDIDALKAIDKKLKGFVNTSQFPGLIPGDREG